MTVFPHFSYIEKFEEFRILRYMKNINRRKFIRRTSLSAASFLASSKMAYSEEHFRPLLPNASYMGDFAAPKMENLRIAIIGVGARGPGHLTFSAAMPGTEIVAICDLYEDLVMRSKKMVEEIGQGSRHTQVATYFGSEHAWKNMLNDVSPDLVFVVTNWKNHAPMAIECMQKGAHAMVEVPLGLTIQELWDVVEASEVTQKHCMMMENVNYDRDELMFLNMVRQGVIGELLHGEAAYIHELRGQMNQVERGTGSWRTHHYADRNGNLYPTHGLGPVAQYMNLARGEDNFESIVSYSTPALGRDLYARKNFGDDHQWNKLDYKGGDLNTSLIKTSMGRTVMVQWDETSPRPYSRLNLIQGTKGTLAGYPTRAALEGGLEGATKDHHSWIEGDDLELLYEKYDHPLYKRLNEVTKDTGHGGMDGMMLYRIIECLQNGWPLDQNVYEGAFWSAVSPLSERSVASGGMPQPFPDFTKGFWKETKPLKIVA